MSLSHVAGPGSHLVTPVCWLTFHGDKSPNAHSAADEDYLYVVANELVFAWDLVVNTGKHVFHLVRQAGDKDPMYVDKINSFKMEPVTIEVWNKIADAEQAGLLKAHITLRLRFHKLFHRVLHQLARDDPDLDSMANPLDRKDFTNTVKRRGLNRFKFPFENSRVIKDIPCKFSDGPIISIGANPIVKRFKIYLDIRSIADRVLRDQIVIPLLAADWSQIYKHGEARGEEHWYKKTKASPSAKLLPVEARLRIWETNVWNYFCNYTDLKRGEAIANRLIDAGKTKLGAGAAKVVRAVRDAIDAQVITANHWSDAREKGPKHSLEHYQKVMADAFGAIHAKRYRASPVVIFRSVWSYLIKDQRGKSVNDGEQAKCILVLGAGHCNEHATLSFIILGAIRRHGGDAVLGPVIRSGQANVDHVFVIGGFEPEEIVIGKVNWPGNTTGIDPGTEIFLIDLSAVVAREGKGFKGWVCDPYLHHTHIPHTVSGLLKSLNRKGRKNRTPFVRWNDVTPKIKPNFVEKSPLDHI